MIRNASGLRVRHLSNDATKPRTYLDYAICNLFSQVFNHPGCVRCAGLARRIPNGACWTLSASKRRPRKFVFLYLKDVEDVEVIDVEVIWWPMFYQMSHTTAQIGVQ